MGRTFGRLASFVLACLFPLASVAGGSGGDTDGCDTRLECQNNGENCTYGAGELDLSAIDQAEIDLAISAVMGMKDMPEREKLQRAERAAAGVDTQALAKAIKQRKASGYQVQVNKSRFDGHRRIVESECASRARP